MLAEEEVSRVVRETLSRLNTPKMSLDLALRLTEKMKAKAAELGVNDVIAVADAGGNTVSVQSMDNAYLASVDIAINKAYTVVSLKMPTKALAELAAPGGSLYGIQFTNGGRIVIFGGGVPLYAPDGSVIGGFGVSGGTAEQDTALGDYASEIFPTLLY